jgi:antitoxin MazE
VRIPAAVKQSAGLQLDQPVEVREQNGYLIIKPVRDSRLSLDTLLAGTTPGNLHGSIDFGPARGAESW